jgi:plasmid stabilization system protein ParE
VTRTVIFRPTAAAELREAHAWYEERRPGLGSQLRDEIDRAVERVRESPELYAEVHGPIRRALIHRFPYGLFYLVEPERIVVVAVFHGRRDPKVWQGRL